MLGKIRWGSNSRASPTGQSVKNEGETTQKYNRYIPLALLSMAVTPGHVLKSQNTVATSGAPEAINKQHRLGRFQRGP